VKTELVYVVPLRLASTRLPRKVLARIGQSSMGALTIAKTLSASELLGGRVQVCAAVDAEETRQTLKKEFPKLKVIMTSPDLASGTDRVAAALAELRREDPQLNPKGVVNVQGDTPFVGTEGLIQVGRYFLESPEAQLQTHGICTLAQTWEGDLKDLSKVKVLVNRHQEAIYFSRFPIPYSRVKASKNSKAPVIPQLHIGVYGFTPKALAQFCAHKATPLESHEGLEQLRALDLGLKILVFETSPRAHESFRGIDTKEDLLWARNFARRKTNKK